MVICSLDRIRRKGYFQVRKTSLYYKVCLIHCEGVLLDSYSLSGILYISHYSRGRLLGKCSIMIFICIMLLSIEMGHWPTCVVLSRKARLILHTIFIGQWSNLFAFGHYRTIECHQFEYTSAREFYVGHLLQQSLYLSHRISFQLQTRGLYKHQSTSYCLIWVSSVYHQQCSGGERYFAGAHSSKRQLDKTGLSTFQGYVRKHEPPWRSY